MQISKTWIILVLCAAGALSACDMFDTQSAAENQPPSVELANIPAPNQDPPSDTLFALVTLHWDGGDQDGFIAGYEYQYTTIECEDRRCTEGDTVQTPAPTAPTDWERTDSTSQTIAFNSPREVNKQIFRVRAIDDAGARSEPAVKTFFTGQSIPPSTDIATPGDGSERFAQEETSDWWQGIPITFSGEAGNEDAQIVEYGWRVDEGDFRWTQDTSVVIPPEAFTSLQGEHTIQVTARDNTNLTAHQGGQADRITITLVRPSLTTGRLLIIDETNEGANGSGIDASDDEVDAFYQDVFEPDAVWDYFEEGGPPPRSMLGEYGVVLWHADNNYSSPGNTHNLNQHTGLLSDYMNVGGDFIMSGWRILAPFAGGVLQRYPNTTSFGEDSFVNEYLHITRTSTTPAGELVVGGDFQGAKTCNRRQQLCDPEESPYQPMRVDSAKLAGIVHNGYLSEVNVIPAGGFDEEGGTASFTEPIFYYWQRQYEDGPPIPRAIHRDIVGLRYFGTVFDAVVFGFPLYFMEDAGDLAEDVLRELGHREN